MPLSVIALPTILRDRIIALGATPVLNANQLQRENATNLLWNQLLPLLSSEGNGWASGVRTITGAGVMVATDDGLFIDQSAGGAATTFTLLDATALRDGFNIVLRKSDAVAADTITLTPAAGDTISGPTVLDAQFEALFVVRTGATTWATFAIVDAGSNVGSLDNAALRASVPPGAIQGSDLVISDITGNVITVNTPAAATSTAINIVAGNSSGDAVGANFTARGGAGVGTNRAGGNSELIAGAGIGSATGGIAALTGGAGGATGGGGTVALFGGAGGATSGAGGSISARAGDAANGNSAGGSITVQSGNATGNAAGGTTTILGGIGGATSGNGGAIVITGGAAGTGDATGGAVGITGGAGTGVNNGGAVNVTGGAADTEGDGGIVTILGGQGGSFGGGTNNGGAVNITGGPALNTNTGGAVNINGGTSAGGTVGSVNVGTGASTTKVTICSAANTLAFFAGAGTTKQDVTGARDDPEAALANLLTALAAYGLITNSTTAT